MRTFEQLLPGEDDDIREIVAGMAAVQSETAQAQHRPLGRGTHTKGVCVRGTFEVYDLTAQIADPVLRARLSHELFARPGVYPATIRFANAASKRQPDYTGDVRAVSVAVDLPAGVLGPDAMRRDFSLNNAPTFPINDAHAFAVLMRVLHPGTAWGFVKAIASLSPSDWGTLIMIGVRGFPQTHSPVRPYQRARFWSNVAFRHGPDEAVKYSVAARASNPSGGLVHSADMLRDDLVRHVETGERMSEFDFAIQLLDADRQRHFFRKRDAIWWVENAGIEWAEQAAPFHPVGRLVLAHDSVLPDDECEQFHIDVNEHCTSESHPLGSINRARWFAESNSRRRRLGLEEAAQPATVPGRDMPNPLAPPNPRSGAPLPAPAPRRGSWVGGRTLGGIGRAAAVGAFTLLLLVEGFAVFATAKAHSSTGMLPVEHIDRVVFQDVGLGAGLESRDRQSFYYTAQGAGLKDLRYSWFVNLEMPWGSTRLADPAVMTRYGFLVDPATARNPDRLPVGFTKHFDPVLKTQLLDITCATCHTGQLTVTRNGQTTAVRIDGGQASHALTDGNPGQFLFTLIASMSATLTNPLKFDLFARRVLGSRYPHGYLTLHNELRDVWWQFTKLGFTELHRGLVPTREGFGRTDALARIGNTVFAENLDPDNYKVGNAPVSFPPLWNIWNFDFVQYNASVSQPMARNLGEAMGVGAKYALVDRYGAPLPPSERFRSTARIDDLDRIENILRGLRQPQWDPDILGPIDSARAAAGQLLFNQHCEGCHGPHLASDGIKKRNSPLKATDDPEWLVTTICASEIGTDPNAARNFDTSYVDITRTGLTAVDLRASARRTLDSANARDSVYLVADIKALESHSDAASLAQIKADRAALANLHLQTDQTLSQIDPRHLQLGAALSYLGTMIRDKAYDDGHYTPQQRSELDGFGTLDMPRVIDAYKARPLAGIWATPPYLHNGSVPTIYDLLSPVVSRPGTFPVGVRAFDTAHLGLARRDGYPIFDTSLPGNHNTGHEFSPAYNAANRALSPPGVIGPLLSESEKLAIIEYLKIRDDDRDGKKTPSVPHEQQCVVTP